MKKSGKVQVIARLQYLHRVAVPWYRDLGIVESRGNVWTTSYDKEASTILKSKSHRENKWEQREELKSQQHGERQTTEQTKDSGLLGLNQQHLLQVC